MNPTSKPSRSPLEPGQTNNPTMDPTIHPTDNPSINPTINPSSDPSINPTSNPTSDTTSNPTSDPTSDPPSDPTSDPTSDPITIDSTTTVPDEYENCGEATLVDGVVLTIGRRESDEMMQIIMSGPEDAWFAF